MAKKGFGCERPECGASTDISGEASFGTGGLSRDGFWEFPCEECRNAWRLWQKWGKEVSVVHDVTTAPKLYTVKLSYFKTRGKWYSDGEYQSKHTELFDIWDEVRGMRDKRHLPGLMEGCSEFIVLIDVPDHPHNHPHLII